MNSDSRLTTISSTTPRFCLPGCFHASPAKSRLRSRIVMACLLFHYRLAVLCSRRAVSITAAVPGRLRTHQAMSLFLTADGADKRGSDLVISITRQFSLSVQFAQSAVYLPVLKRAAVVEAARFR